MYFLIIFIHFHTQTHWHRWCGIEHVCSAHMAPMAMLSSHAKVLARCLGSGRNSAAASRCCCCSPCSRSSSFLLFAFYSKCGYLCRNFQHCHFSIIIIIVFIRLSSSIQQAPIFRLFPARIICANPFSAQHTARRTYAF